jgi:hypothetical protein
VAVDSAELCFRGEWDGRPEASGHAQPHWNIDLFQPGAEINDLEMSGQGFSWNGISDKTKTVATQDAFNYFHFAMASNWQTKDGWHSQVLKEEEEFLRWSSGCASYIKAQLRAQISAQ